MVDKINVINQRISLERTYFEKLPRLQEQPKAVLDDEVIDFKLNNNRISFYFKRTLRAEPESIYKIYVLFSYESEIAADSIESLSKSGLLNEKFLMEKAPKIINSTSMCGVASQIIANITAINGGHPFIAPPVFIEK